DVGLAAERSFRADLSCFLRLRRGEGVALFPTRRSSDLEVQDLAPDVDGDLLREVALLDRGRDLGDVADLAGEVAGHEVDVVGEVLRDPGDALAIDLPA